ncbi:MAG: GGDEF domain-containing protein, partial [Sedimentibacter sp.]
VIRSGDTVARYGGEEFFVILPETDEEGAVVFAKKLRIAIENLAIPHEQSTISKVVTTSIGVVTLEPKLLTSPEEAIIYVDKAMYHAKLNGRDQIFFKGYLGKSDLQQ